MGAAHAVLLKGGPGRLPLTLAAAKASFGHAEPAAGAVGLRAAMHRSACGIVRRAHEVSLSSISTALHVAMNLSASTIDAPQP